MTARNGGVAFTIIVVLVISMAFGYILTSGTSSNLVPPTNAVTKHVGNITMWADAGGWELKQGPAATSYDPSATSLINQIFYFNESTLVYINLTEADGAPHTFTIAYDGANTSSLYSSITTGIYQNPTKYESSNSYTIISISQLTQNVGHFVSKTYPFEKPGIYTYWCTVHPTAMYGLIIINGASS